jgi:hypothetical protein
MNLKYLNTLPFFVIISIYNTSCASQKDCAVSLENNSTQSDNNNSISENNSTDINITQILKSLYLSGVAVDGELKGATVQISDKNISTNINGEWNISLYDLTNNLITSDGNFTGTTIIVSGGIDSGTGEAFEGELRAFAEPMKLESNLSKYLAVTPISTLLSAMINNGTSYNDAKIKISKILDINESDLYKNPIEMSNSKDIKEQERGLKIIKDGLIIQKFVESFNKFIPNDSEDKNLNSQFFKIFEAIGTNISTENDIYTYLNNNSDMIVENIAKKFDQNSSEELKLVAEISKSTAMMINEMDNNLLLAGGDGWRAVETISLKVEDEISKFKKTDINFSEMQNSINGLIIFGGVDRIASDMKSADYNLTSSQKMPSTFYSSFLDSDILKDGNNIYREFESIGLDQNEIFKIATDRYKIDKDSNFEMSISNISDKNLSANITTNWNNFDSKITDKIKPPKDKDNDNKTDPEYKPPLIAPKVFIVSSKTLGTTQDVFEFKAQSDNPSTCYSWFINDIFYSHDANITKKFIAGKHKINLIGSIKDLNNSNSIYINVSEYIYPQTSNNGEQNITQILKSLYLSGVAIDGALSGSNVTIGNKNTITDMLGNWKIEFKENEKPITNIEVSVSGGIDQSTGESFEGQLKTITNPDNLSENKNSTDNIPVTPLTTIFSAMVDSGMSLENAKTSLSISLGLDIATLDSNPIDLLNSDDPAQQEKGAEAIKNALMIQKVAETMTKSITGDSSDTNLKNSIFSSIISGISSMFSTDSNSTIGDILKNSDKIAEESAEKIKENNSSVDINLMEKLKTAGEISQSIVTMIQQIDTKTLNSDQALENISKATEIATSKIETQVSELSKPEANIASIKENSLKVSNALIMLGGISEISQKIETASTLSEQNIDASDFSAFLSDEVINANANLYQQFKDLNLDSSQILNIANSLNNNSDINISEIIKNETNITITADNLSQISSKVNSTNAVIEKAIPIPPVITLSSILVSAKVGETILFNAISDKSDTKFSWYINNILVTAENNKLDYQFSSIGTYKVKVVGYYFGLSSKSNELEIVISQADDKDYLSIGNTIHIGSINQFETDKNLSNKNFGTFSVENANSKDLALVRPEVINSLFYINIPIENGSNQTTLENGDSGLFKVTLSLEYNSTNKYSVETKNIAMKYLNNEFSITKSSESSIIVQNEIKAFDSTKLYISNNNLVVKLSDYLNNSVLIDGNYTVQLKLESSLISENNITINGNIAIVKKSGGYEAPPSTPIIPIY